MCPQPKRAIVDTSLKKLLAIIPVRNEESTILGVIQDLQSYGLANIRVVDNGSSDRSATLASQAGAEVIREHRPGYGQACWRGLQDLPADVEWILFCDGDGSDDLSCLPEFLSLRERFDLILGDRRATPAGKAVMTPVQHFGNGLASWLISWGWGYRYHDLGPLRLIRRSSLDQIDMQDRGFGWTVEMQVRAIEEDLKICEIPVNYRPRQGGQSKISGTVRGSIQAGTIILSTLGKLWWQNHNAGEPHQPTSTQNRNSFSQQLSSICLWVSSLLLIIGAIRAAPYGDFRQANNVIQFGYGMAVMSCGFAATWWLKRIPGWWFWLIAIAVRLILLPMEPGDDIWRYLWEGKIQNLGFSPYELAPKAKELIAWRTDWWSQINHPGVTAIYPPLTQLGFRGLAAISPSVLLFKSSFIAADLLTCWLLTKKFSYAQTTFYAWNPLVIYSFAGGGHYDSWLILPLVGAWIIWERNRLVSAGLLGVSIAIKWISCPILGFLGLAAWRQHRHVHRSGLNIGQLIAIFTLGILPICLSALTFCSPEACHLIPTSSTFVSHGRSAEFFPHFLGLVWPSSLKSNSLFALPLGLAVLCLLWRVQTIQQFILGFFTSLLLISPIVHGWYFTWMMPFAVGTKNWGVRLVSLSAFLYFLLPYRYALGNRDWNLNTPETWWLWLPLIIGFLWSWWHNSQLKNQQI